MNSESKSENAAKVEEQVRVVQEGNEYEAVLWIGDRYVSGGGKSEDEARARLCMTIYELVGEGRPINPLNLPTVVRKGVLEYGGKLADLARSELIKKTAEYLRFTPHIGYPPLPPRRSATGINAWRHDQLTLGELHEQGQGAAQRPVRYVSPPFQRPLRWSARRRCDYLQSMLLGEPQPPLALWQPQGAEHTLVLDGQHRLASLGCEVYGADGQRRVLDDVRLNLHTLEWEPGAADGLSTLSPDRLLKPHHHLWLNKQASDEGWWDHVVSIIKRLHSHNQTPVLLSTAPETPAAWREAVSFFARMAQSVPFTEAELEAMTTYASGMDKNNGAANNPDVGEAPTR